MSGGVSLPTLNIQAADDASPDEDTVLQVSITPPEEGKLGAIGPETFTRRGSHFNSENWRHGDLKPEIS
jgi:hypothetical protein